MHLFPSSCRHRTCSSAAKSGAAGAPASTSCALARALSCILPARPGCMPHQAVCFHLPAGLSDACTSPLASSLPPCRGSDLRLPFECPADYVFYTPLMDMQPGLDYRVPGFLEDPRVRWACWACCAACAAHAGGPCHCSVAPIGSPTCLDKRKAKAKSRHPLHCRRRPPKCAAHE